MAGKVSDFRLLSGKGIVAGSSQADGGIVPDNVSARRLADGGDVVKQPDKGIGEGECFHNIRIVAMLIRVVQQAARDNRDAGTAPLFLRIRRRSEICRAVMVYHSPDEVLNRGRSGL